MKRNEILDCWVKVFREHFDIELVRRHRGSANGKYVEFIFHSPLIEKVTGRQNTLKEAEACGYWAMVRKQTSPKRQYYKGHQVFQMFLTPVHPKKKYVDKVLAAVALEFTPVVQRKRKMARNDILSRKGTIISEAPETSRMDEPMRA